MLIIPTIGEAGAFATDDEGFTITSAEFVESPTPLVAKIEMPYPVPFVSAVNVAVRRDPEILKRLVPAEFVASIV